MKTWELLKKNPELFQRYFVKEYIIKACRRFFEHRNYHELESPIITDALPQERYINVLQTNILLKNNKQVTGYLTPTTETYNKKMLAAGLGEHFVITKVARGLEEISPNHSPEFTMLEWYHLDANYFDLMNDCEELFEFIIKFLKLAQSFPASKIHKLYEMDYETINSFETDLTITYKNQVIDFSSGWYKISIPDVIKKTFDIELEDILTLEQIKKFAQNRGYLVSDEDDWQIIFEMLFANEIEPTFPKDQPIFVYDYPKILCPLVKENENNPLVCQKVELYVAGKELANGYTELIDGDEQEKRFIEEQKARKELGLPEIKMDTELIKAIKSGMPDVAGIGMGLDRLAMILANADTISDINFFPGSELFE